MAWQEPVPLPLWMDRYKASRIAQLRSMGFSQTDIAEQLGLSQQTVSRYTRGINEAAKESGDLEGFLWSLLLIGGGVALVASLLRLMQDNGRT